MRDLLFVHAYMWIKAVHVIFVIAWMAGLLIYPRYKIHQLGAIPGGELARTMSDAAARLKRIILTPSMTFAWVLGLSMLWINPGLLSVGWVHVKLTLLLALTGLHVYFTRMGRGIDAGSSTMSASRLRLLNEAPFIIMIGIVLMAVAKPF